MRFSVILVPLLLFLISFGVSVKANPVASKNNVTVTNYLSRYELDTTRQPVYGLFQIQGAKPSLRLSNPAPNAGFLLLALHASRSITSANQAFITIIRFFDTNGNPVGPAFKVPFQSDLPNTTPKWFTGLNEIAGIQGQQLLCLPIPSGSQAVQLFAQGKEGLLGFVSRFDNQSTCQPKP